MNVFAFLLLSSTKLLHDLVNCDGQNAVTIAYYPPEENYVIVDFKLARLMNLASTMFGYHPMFTGSILCCGLQLYIQGRATISLKFGELWFQNALNLNDQNICDSRPLPTALSVQDGYDIGYEISDSAQSEHLSDLLPAFKNKIDQSSSAHFAVYSIHFDESTQQTNHTEHRFLLFRYSHRKLAPCDNSTTDSQDQGARYIIKNAAVKKYYNLNNQNKLLEDVAKLETMTTKSWWTFDIGKTVIRESPFVKHRLVPTDDYIDKASRDATCFTVNTVPVWKTVSTGLLKNVEKFIRNLAHLLPANTLHVTTIAYDTLQMKRKTDQTLKDIYLDYENRRFPVPKFLIKFLTYRMPAPLGQLIRQIPTAERYIAIVVSNDIFNNTPMCDKIVCKDVGWFIQDDTGNDEFYCCSPHDPALQSILDKFRIPYHNEEIFNLTKIPIQVDDQGNVVETKNFVDIL